MKQSALLRLNTIAHTFFDDECALLGLSGIFTQATHVLREDPEVILIPNHKLCDGNAGAMVVLNAREPFL